MTDAQTVEEIAGNLVDEISDFASPWRGPEVYTLCLDALRTVARRALSQEGGEWQAVGSAPKDGTDFLATFDPAVGWMQIIKWHEKKRGYGWCCSYTNKRIYNSPTHWMPLPPSPSVSVERECPECGLTWSHAHDCRHNTVPRLPNWRVGNARLIDPSWEGEMVTTPDTPQSVPACTCSKHPLWDGYDGDCPIHGWFEPVTPDAPLSQGELLVRDRNIDAVDALIAERDKLKGLYADCEEANCERKEQVAQLVERVSVLEKELVEAKEISGVDKAIQSGALQATVSLRTEIERLRGELQWIADTPLKWTKAQNDVYWSNVAVAMAKKAMDALSRTSEDAEVTRSQDH
jgi:hypothetical protein